MLPYLRSTRSLRFTRPGRLLPWLGPALRGLLAQPFKERVCRQPPAEREQRWVTCAGCPLMAGCPYGETFELDSTAILLSQGRDQTPRPVVLELPFPMPFQARVGDPVPVTITFVETREVRCTPGLDPWCIRGASVATKCLALLRGLVVRNPS